MCLSLSFSLFLCARWLVGVDLDFFFRSVFVSCSDYIVTVWHKFVEMVASNLFFPRNFLFSISQRLLCVAVLNGGECNDNENDELPEQHWQHIYLWWSIDCVVCFNSDRKITLYHNMTMWNARTMMMKPTKWNGKDGAQAIRSTKNKIKMTFDPLSARFVPNLRLFCFFFSHWWRLLGSITRTSRLMCVRTCAATGITRVVCVWLAQIGNRLYVRRRRRSTVDQLWL